MGYVTSWGACVVDAGVRFRLWAPSARSVALALSDRAERIPMLASADGWYEHVEPGIGTGTRYRYEIDGELLVPDPASRFQPEGLDGPSEVLEPAALHRTGRPWRAPAFESLVFYEMHVGTFTSQGTYAAARERLRDVAALGVTAIELMPLAQAPGTRNWGYDGVLHYAPQRSYGSPQDLCELIDAAHELGMSVFLDVVYNHFGPQGNYLYRYARSYFTGRHHTPWGDAIDYSSPENDAVRRYAIENARYWIEAYGFDGLRLDAVQAIYDDRPRQLLDDLVSEVKAHAGRTVYLVLENDDNSVRLLEAGYDAQWNDDLHHALHAAITGESGGYYSDYASDPAHYTARALTSGFGYQGEASAFRNGAHRGAPSAHLPLRSFVNFLQNHDQIGNRALGERITNLAPAAAVRAAIAVLLLAPSPPLLFMGEEWGASTPFLFFCDFEPQLAKAVKAGRRNEFSSFPEFADSAARERIPDPGAYATFEASKLRWEEREQGEHAQWLAYYRQLLVLRRERIVPDSAGLRGSDASFTQRGGAFTAQWRLDGGSTLALDVNLQNREAAGFAQEEAGVFFATHEPRYAGGIAPPWSVRWSLQ